MSAFWIKLDFQMIKQEIVIFFYEACFQHWRVLINPLSANVENMVTSE